MSATKLFRSFAIFFIIILFTLSCSQKKPEFSPQQLAKFNLLSTEADMFYESGSYVSLKKAFAIYEDQQTFYNAAAVYFNAGQGKKALELAQNARDSKTLKSKVEELINKIKEKNKLEYSRVEVAVAARQWPVKLY